MSLDTSNKAAVRSKVRTALSGQAMPMTPIDAAAPITPMAPIEPRQIHEPRSQGIVIGRHSNGIKLDITHSRRLHKQVIEQLQRDDPLLAVPQKSRRKQPVAFFANYLVPTRYMRFYWASLWFILLSSLPGRRLQPVPYIPQVSASAHNATIEATTQNAVLRHGKAVAVFNYGGGVGKTTLCINLALQLKQLRADLSVNAIDCDEGTLVQRVVRNCRNSFLDFLGNLGYIKEPIDLAPYCTVYENVQVFPWRREGQLDDVREVTRQEILDGVRLLSAISPGVSLFDLPGGKGPRHRGVLDGCHQVVMVTISADDRLDQTVTAYGWLIENGYEHLARTAIIVINNVRSYDEVEKVRERFLAKHAAYMGDVRFQVFFHNRQLAKGGVVKLSYLPRKHRRSLERHAALLLEGLADAHRSDDDSMMTHSEMEQVADASPMPIRWPRVGRPTPGLGPELPDDLS